MATSFLSLFKRTKAKSKLQKSPDKETLRDQSSGSSSPTDAVTSGPSLKSPPPGTIFTFDNFSAMENTLAHRKAAK